MTSNEVGWEPTGNTFVLDCHIEGDLDAPWMTGALSVMDPDGATKGGLDRGTYFAARTAQLLYGDGTTGADSPFIRGINRWHRRFDFEVCAGVKIQALEVTAALPFDSLQPNKEQGTPARRIAVLICHLSVAHADLSPEVLNRLWAATRDRTGRNTFYRAVQQDLGTVITLGGNGQVSFDGDHRYAEESPRVFSVFLDEQPTIQKNLVEQYGPVAALAMHARVVASLAPPERMGGLSAERVGRAQAATRELSNSWVHTVLSDGAAFVMNPGQTFAPARMLVSTIYTDAFALVRLQSNIIDEFVNRAGTLVYEERNLSLEDVASIQSDLVKFRTIYWKGSLNPAKRARAFLASLEDELGLPTALDGLVNEVEDLVEIAKLNREVRAEEHQKRTDTLIGLVTVVGFPMAIALSVWSGVDRLSTLPWLILLSAIAVGAGLLVYLAVHWNSKGGLASLRPVATASARRPKAPRRSPVNRP